MKRLLSDFWLRVWTRVSKTHSAIEEQVYTTATPALFQRPGFSAAPFPLKASFLSAYLLRVMRQARMRSSSTRKNQSENTVLDAAKKVINFLHTRRGIEQCQRTHSGKVWFRRAEPVTHGIGITEDIQGVLVEHCQMVESI